MLGAFLALMVVGLSCCLKPLLGALLALMVVGPLVWSFKLLGTVKTVLVGTVKTVFLLIVLLFYKYLKFHIVMYLISNV